MKDPDTKKGTGTFSCLAKKVSKLLSKGTTTKTCAELVTASIGNLRKLIKAELAEEIKEIDGIVRGDVEGLIPRCRVIWRKRLQEIYKKDNKKEKLTYMH